MSRQTPWGKFKSFYTLLALFLEFVSGECGGANLMQQPMDLLCQHINDFIHEGVSTMVSRYNLGHLSVFRRQTLLLLLAEVFGWLMAKGFVSYRITLN